MCVWVFVWLVRFLLFFLFFFFLGGGGGGGGGVLGLVGFLFVLCYVLLFFPSQFKQL